MRLQVKVKPASRNPGIEKIDETEWVVRVREPASEGKANLAVIRAVARELGIPAGRVQLLRGNTSRTKLLEIED